MVFRLVGKVLLATVVMIVSAVFAVALMGFWQQYWYLAAVAEVVSLGAFTVWLRYLFFPARSTDS